MKKNHLIEIGEWSEEQHKDMYHEIVEKVQTSYKEALTFGTMEDEPKLPASTMFEDVYKEPLPHLEKQRRQMQQEK